MSLLLKSLAGIERKTEPIRVEIVKGEFLEFRSPGEGEIDDVRADAEREAESYFKENYQPTVQQKEWLPALKETFIRATILSRFLIDDDPKGARRLFCKIGKNSPITFGVIFSSWQTGSVSAELKQFCEEVEARKNSSAPTTSGTSD
jgi:hypothetical protein